MIENRPLDWTNMKGSNLIGAIMISGTRPNIPYIKNLDQKILDILDQNKGELDMRKWHTCETTHCRAGWAITLAGAKGYDLEVEFGTFLGGSLIYAKSYPDLPLPNFRSSNEDAMKDMRIRAGARGIKKAYKKENNK